MNNPLDSLPENHRLPAVIIAILALPFVVLAAGFSAAVVVSIILRGCYPYIGD